MIRFLRMASIVLFAAAVIVYGTVSIYTERRSDGEGPEIIMAENEITISAGDDASAVLSGVTAEDKKDGDVTSLMVLESMSNMLGDNTREAVIAAFDEDGNVSKAVRKVKYSDYVPTRISLSAPLKASVHNASKIISCIKATDCLDGDISSNVQLISKEPLNGVSTGEYRMDIHVSNSAGDAVVLPVTVELYDYDSQNNSIGIVLSDYLVYIKAGQKIDPKSYLKGISRYEKTYSYDADYYSSEYPPYDKDEIVIENNVDVNTAGVYEIKYSIRDNERIRGSVRLVVVVE